MRRLLNAGLKTVVAAFAVVCMAATLLAAPQTATSIQKGEKGKAVLKSKKADKAKKDQASKQDQTEALKKQLAAQQEQINKLLGMVEQLTQRLNAQTETKQAATSSAQPAKQTAEVAAAKLSGQYPSMSKVASLSPILPASQAATNLASVAPISLAAPAKADPAQTAGDESGSESPLHFQLGTAYFTPVGFMDFTSVWRSTNLGSGIGTNFAGLPYGNGIANNLSELTMSMQNSRVGLRIDAETHGAHVLAYLETDFLGNNPGNYSVSSNSNTLRSRVFWLDVRKGDWEVLGGQTWSLITPGRKGISGIPGDVFFSQDIDTNYQAGLFWGRIPEFRVVYHPSKIAAFAVALDDPQQYAGGSSGGPLITFPSALASAYGTELNTGANGSKVPNVAPDVIAKLALDPSSRLHFEIGGVERNFKLYNPNSSQNYTATGGGGFLNLNVGLFSGLRLVTNNFWSDGGGRYIFGQVPDLIVKADGAPSLIHTGSTVSGLEFTHGKTLVYGYYGGIYVSRNTAVDTNSNLIGYGYAGSGSSQNRSIQEGTFGFNRTIWHDPKWGAVNFMGQYSYVTRNPWSVAAGTPSNASINMVFFNLRFSLPGTAPVMGK